MRDSSKAFFLKSFIHDLLASKTSELHKIILQKLENAYLTTSLISQRCKNKEKRQRSRIQREDHKANQEIDSHISQEIVITKVVVLTEDQ